MKSALVLIDVQRGMFTLPGSLAHDADAILTRIATLLGRAREHGVPVIHVQHEDEPGDVLARGSDGWLFHPSAAPLAEEPVVGKQHCSAFQGTALRDHLAESGVEMLVVAGLQTQFCIDTACRVATTLGYRVILASDAHTTFDTPDLTAAAIVAHHNTTLRAFATVIPSSEITFGAG